MPKENRLASEISPYLLQHRTNPVDWYPWGEEAFEKARREDKPVFLSVGYSSCHWCHVMERESFEDEEVAKILNEGFVSVKVDREERPDVDDVYMRVTQMMTGHGGWPMTVFMTPDKRPFFAGTYFPREHRFGQPAFPRILEEIRKAWTTRRAEVERSATEIADAVAHSVEGVAPPPPGVKLDASLVKIVASAYERRFDDEHGGFGDAPKFPPHQALRLFLAEPERSAPRGIEMARKTLDEMAAGGIHDHVGGGFHRYAVDAEWLVPHFEKMLYDNGLFAWSFAAAFQQTGFAPYRRAAERIFAWVAREMTDPLGGFYSALDADSEGEEGKYYVWTPAEVESVLGAAAGRELCAFFDVTAGGNWEGKSILRVRPAALPEAARFDPALAALLEARRKRVPPGLDDKVLAGWNGLMIAGYARGFAAFGDPALRAAAEKAAAFVLESMRAEGGRLYRSWRRGRAGIPAYLEDYAYLGDGLLELFEATKEARWLDAARELADIMLEDFADPKGGLFSTSARHERLLFREKEGFDGATPAPNGVAARLLARLARAGAGERYGREADRTIESFAGALPRAAYGMVTLAEAVGLRGEVRPDPAAREPVTATALVRGVLAPGGEAEVVLRLDIAPGRHVNAPAPGLDYLVPFVVKPLGSDPPVRFGETVYPAAKEWRAPFADAPISVYDGVIEARVPVHVEPGAVPGRGRIRLEARWQACDDRQCHAPVRAMIEIPVEILAPS